MLSFLPNDHKQKPHLLTNRVRWSHCNSEQVENSLSPHGVVIARTGAQSISAIAGQCSSICLLKRTVRPVIWFPQTNKASSLRSPLNPQTFRSLPVSRKLMNKRITCGRLFLIMTGTFGKICDIPAVLQSGTPGRAMSPKHQDV